MSIEEVILKDFKKTIGRLEEVLRLRKTKIIRDSAIKRFELCFDLAWKSIKVYAKNQNVECVSPRDCIKTAFQLKLIDYNENWLKIIDDRNLTAHIYKEEYADQVYSRLKMHLELFKNLYFQLK
ncbi:nucleotidyltransferase substrate binding protein, partial [Patescibacteria group bacterium]|nr:nucleotidyltransferase substrate binding protein [Patescibacteria group bacterium]